LAKTISEVGGKLFSTLFCTKNKPGQTTRKQEINKMKTVSSLTPNKWRVSSEMNIERDARRSKHGVKSEQHAVTAEYKLGA
jgi:hypothetical protein